MDLTSTVPDLDTAGTTKPVVNGMVSIIMPVYNGEKYLKESVDSVLAQTYCLWELIVVDDGSTDHSLEIVRRYSSDRIKLVQQSNRGGSAARNAALEIARGEFIAFLDADDLYLSHHLEATVGYLGTHRQMDAVYVDGHYIDQDGKPIRTLSSRRRGAFEGDIFEQVVLSSDVFGAPVCVVLRQKLLDKKKLKFDENIIIGEDWDFFMKCAESGNFGYLDQTTCLYRVHTSNISVRTGMEKRALELSKCRVNAIKMEKFASCSVQTQVTVFYHLLVDLLLDLPEQQTEITLWPEFVALPEKLQARLLRLMASATIVYGKDHSFVEGWLQRAVQLDLLDFRSVILAAVHFIHPKLLHIILKAAYRRKNDPRAIQPFADMKQVHELIL